MSLLSGSVHVSVRSGQLHSWSLFMRQDVKPSEAGKLMAWIDGQATALDEEPDYSIDGCG